MFSKLIRALLGAFGIIKRTKKFTTANNAAFMRSLEAGAVIITAAREANFVQGGIQGATDSFWQHALIYVGKTAGALVRQTFPYLLLNPKIPKEAQINEIIEAQGEGVIVSTLDKNFGDSQQMIAYARPISTIELLKILHRAYAAVGRPYDFGEFVGDVLPDGMEDMVPNNADLFVCSTLAIHAWLPIEIIVKSKVDPKRGTPKDINEYLEPDLKWGQTRYNW